VSKKQKRTPKNCIPARQTRGNPLIIELLSRRKTAIQPRFFLTGTYNSDAGLPEAPKKHGKITGEQTASNPG
jgi:hypothetical protein